MSKIIISITVIMLFMTLEISSQSCIGFPKFINEIGFDKSRVALSSMERKIMGVAVIEFPKDGSGGQKQIYVDPTWDDAGFLGAITRDKDGNLYVAPRPNVNMLHNPYSNQNSIFVISSLTGKMKRFMDLPLLYPETIQNPFGLIGSFYDCDSDALIMSTLSGSDQKKERGIIYSINVNTKEYHSILEDVDALSVAIIKVNGKRLLLFGKTRSSSIWSAEIDNSNKLITSPILMINLEGLGEDGDYKARRIRLIKDVLVINAAVFNYNLSSGSLEQTSKFSFRYANGKWVLQ